MRLSAPFSVPSRVERPHSALASFRAVLVVTAVVGCGPDAPPASPSPMALGTPKLEPAMPFVDTPATWGAFHSKRHLLTVHLPDGHAWKVDDHARPELYAIHPATRSELTVSLGPAGDLVGRTQCEAIARKKGLLPAVELRTLEDRVTVGPEAYDTRIWVALEVRPQGQLAAHLFAFGGMIRSCFFFHFRTEVQSLASEEVLTQRLALARTRILDRVDLDPPRVTPDAELPRERESPKKP